MSRVTKRLGRMFVVLLLVMLPVPPAGADEARPAYLEIKETAAGQFSLLWRTPVLSGMRLPIVLTLPADVRNIKAPTVEELADSIVERRWIDAGPKGLSGRRIEFVGLQVLITDVLVRVEMLDGRNGRRSRAPRSRGSKSPLRRHGSRSRARTADGIRDTSVRSRPPALRARSAPDRRGPVDAVDDDHRLHGRAQHHPGIATLGYANAPVVPLERRHRPEHSSWTGDRSQLAGETSFTIRRPWVVAFAFGLLHGFGFAGALTSAGLPRTALPFALLSFNVGVEVGQVGFVLLIVALERSFRVLEVRWPRWTQVLPGYAVGSLGAFWTIQRVVVLLGGAGR